MCETYDNKSVIEAVRVADVCIIAVGLGANVESEGRDREARGLALPGQQNQLVVDAIGAAKAAHIPVVALLFVAGPVDPLLFTEADAIIDCFYPAESTGTAIADVLFGRVSPAGRLPFSWPTLPTDVPPEVNYTMHGRTYRYDQSNVAYPFGHGLSYTSFNYGPAAMGTRSVSASDCASVSVTVTVTNAGLTAADEVVQLYLRWVLLRSPVPTPSLSLVDFARVADIPPGANTTVTLKVTPRVIAVLSEPRCGVVPTQPGIALAGTPFAVLTNGVPTAAECCAACGAKERCEAYTFLAAKASVGASCRLFEAWGLAADSPDAVSGEPLSEWSIRPGIVELLVGRSSAAAVPVGNLTIVGTETPLSRCRLPNSAE